MSSWKDRAQPTRDTKTGKEYRSRTQAGRAVAHEYGLDGRNQFVYYQVVQKDPKRFIPA